MTTAAPHAVCSAPPVPDGPCPVCPRLAQEFEPWRQASSWKALHDRARQRQDLLKQESEQLRAPLRLRAQPLFGRKTQTSAAPTKATTTTRPGAPLRRPRGHQPGRKGPRRRDYSHVPVVVADHEIPGDPGCCRRCGRPFAPVGGTADSTLLEVEVRAPRRLLRRHRYRPPWDCGAHPGVVTAPPAPRVIPKSSLGVTLWAEWLVDQYLS